jgi:hypothetical protein
MTTDKLIAEIEQDGDFFEDKAAMIHWIRNALPFIEFYPRIPCSVDGVSFLDCPDPVAVWPGGREETILIWKVTPEGHWSFNSQPYIPDDVAIFSRPEVIQ